MGFVVMLGGQQMYFCGTCKCVWKFNRCPTCERHPEDHVVTITQTTSTTGAPR